MMHASSNHSEDYYNQCYYSLSKYIANRRDGGSRTDDLESVIEKELVPNYSGDPIKDGCMYYGDGNTQKDNQNLLLINLYLIYLSKASGGDKKEAIAFIDDSLRNRIDRKDQIDVLVKFTSKNAPMGFSLDTNDFKVATGGGGGGSTSGGGGASTADLDKCQRELKEKTIQFDKLKSELKANQIKDKARNSKFSTISSRLDEFGVGPNAKSYILVVPSANKPASFNQ
jgi:hypothetical protein